MCLIMFPCQQYELAKIYTILIFMVFSKDAMNDQPLIGILVDNHISIYNQLMICCRSHVIPAAKLLTFKKKKNSIHPLCNKETSPGGAVSKTFSTSNLNQHFSFYVYLLWKYNKGHIYGITLSEKRLMWSESLHISYTEFQASGFVSGDHND